MQRRVNQLVFWRMVSAFVGCLLLAASSGLHAGYISEITFGSRTVNLPGGGIATMPATIEIAEVATQGPMTLVVMAAKPGTRYGLIHLTLNVAASTTGSGPNVRLVMADAWPAGASPWVFPAIPQGAVTVAANHTLGLLRADGTLEARSLLLFDGPVIGLENNLPPYTGGTMTLANGTKLLDIVTFAPTALAAKALGNEPILRLDDPAMAIVRRLPDDATPLYITGSSDPHAYLLGKPDADGLLQGISPSFLLNPGLTNNVWQPINTTAPEPATLCIFALLTPLVMTRPSSKSRRRRP